MRNSNRPSPLPVSMLLTQMVESVGAGNKKLVEAAQTTYGTLGIKEANVTVDFVLSSTATSRDLTGPILGAYTLLGFHSQEDVQSSHATVNLHIVPIANVAAADKPVDKPPEDANSNEPETNRPWTSLTREGVLSIIEKTLKGVRASVKDVKQQSDLERQLENIRKRVEAGDTAEAFRDLVALFADHTNITDR